MEAPSASFSPSASSQGGSPSRGGGGGGGSSGWDGGDQPYDSTNFNVVIRVRPPLPREEEFFQPAVRVMDERTITISENLAALDDASAAGAYATHTFNFDYVYDQDSDQRTVYDTTAKAVVDSSLKGYNATIFAYGQTGTGKTYTMEGFNSADERGIIPRSIEQIFRHIQELCVSPRKRAFLVRASYLQIYNEVISDLLKPARSNLQIREEKKRGIFVEGLSEWVVRSPAEIYGLMERGGSMRATGSTKMNELSSRSHAVFIIIAEQSETTYLDDSGVEMSVEEFHRLLKSRAHGDAALKALEANVRQSFKVGKLNLVDLAGSERVRLTGATGQRLEETKKINQSLSALGNVIAALTDSRGRQHIPYRDSKLTRILEDSLGGNCKTTMMAMISPALEAFVESLSTLKFANRAKNVKNEARINEDLDQKSLLRRYERELKKLRSELSERAKGVVDSRKLLEKDELLRRAEEDKLAAIRTLEIRSQEFMREKAEKKRLEERISILQQKILLGGAAGGLGLAGAGGAAGAMGDLKEIPAFRNALKEHQERIRAEYEGRLADLEKERETIEEEKAQVDRYKQLLLKQRDIMILLTQRLNERDEQIMALQDELDAYDRHQREVEEKLDEKTAALIHLQRVTLEQDAASPVKNTRLAEALGAWASPGGSERGGGGGGGGVGGSRLGSSLAAAAAAAAGASAYRPTSSTSGYAPQPSHLVAPALLLTTRQFRPHGEGGGGGASPHSPGGAGAGAGGGGSGLLLTGQEKLAELAQLVERGAGERERVWRELEDVRAEKQAMERELKENLAARVSSEMERRGLGGGGAAGAAGAAGAGGAAAVAALERELAAVRGELAAAQRSAASGGSGGGGSGSPRQQAQLEREREEALRRLSHLRKEKEAISSIMENKISALVDSISAGISSSYPVSPSTPQPKWMRELGALDRLVKASIQALKAPGPE